MFSYGPNLHSWNSQQLNKKQTKKKKKHENSSLILNFRKYDKFFSLINSVARETT